MDWALQSTFSISPARRGKKSTGRTIVIAASMSQQEVDVVECGDVVDRCIQISRRVDRRELHVSFSVN
jgi:hypothetical protein